jgi:hypothetical protein
MSRSQHPGQRIFLARANGLPVVQATSTVGQSNNRLASHMHTWLHANTD